MENQSAFNNSKRRPSSHAGHNITSLVDCFAIILIYLLMSTSFGAFDIDTPKDLQLPKAVKTVALKDATVVTVKGHEYLVAGKGVRLEDLSQEFKRLNDSKKSASLLIQADRRANYGDVNPVVMAGLQAGFEEVQFAALAEEKM